MFFWLQGLLSFTCASTCGRYIPGFIDALRDLDDPLTLTHLFALLPADKRHGGAVRVERVGNPC
jgi:hypothetical protein